ncbi:helicase ARIP4-like [Ylistrum balloti]|uniref:helicase ARIP4-like n=1 Tax=Ylistrum balloti TaxID=509963 RepID=UPI002905E4E5|nr:helicase ARIP4-like [Ylistrum balloti]XP_060078470.1 helicase ARIP4-like [Ylistrum balloti]
MSLESFLSGDSIPPEQEPRNCAPGFPDFKLSVGLNNTGGNTLINQMFSDEEDEESIDEENGSCGDLDEVDNDDFEEDDEKEHDDIDGDGDDEEDDDDDEEEEEEEEEINENGDESSGENSEEGVEDMVDEDSKTNNMSKSSVSENMTDDISSIINDLDKDFSMQVENTPNVVESSSPVVENVQNEDDKKLKKLDDEKPECSKPKKRKRKKKEKGEGAPAKKKTKKVKTKKQANMRKNIREIIKENELETTTLAAQNEELERKRRLQEQQKVLAATVPAVPTQVADATDAEEKDSQLKSLLQSMPDEMPSEVQKQEKDDDLILVDSGDDAKKKEKMEVIDISSDDDDDAVQITKDEDSEVDPEDPNNGGNHINDDLNVADLEGRVQLNIGHPPEDDDIYLAPQIARVIKAHQIGGVRFLYDNLIESMERCKSSAGFGCILAHSMGLGKTIQMISFIDIFLRHTPLKSVLLIVPINTLQNWVAEFNIWLPTAATVGDDPNFIPRAFEIYLLNDGYKTTAARAKVIAEWHKSGGVLVMGYEMYRLLSSRRGYMGTLKKPGRKPSSPVVIDLEEEDRNKTHLLSMYEALVSPGPDLVVCDEGHRIKNSHAGISMALKNIRTRRRVVLTGYPLQNNLMEYWCMVDYVRPNYLGTKTEFSNMFERPVMNGQCMDSTEEDVKTMRHRAHVLHSLLEGFVQRRGHTVLQQALPQKQEFVFLIRMSPIQRALYKTFLESVVENFTAASAWSNHNPLRAFATCCKIWNHPDVLHKLLVQRKVAGVDDDLDIDPGNEGRAKKGSQKSKKAVEKQPGSDKKEDVVSFEWAESLMENHMAGLLETGGKMVLLFNILEEAINAGDKILVFSQSLFTLNLLEEFLSKTKVPRPEVDCNWARNTSYYRLDGSTGATEREKMINAFNRPDGQAWLFLLSTRAGSLGVNLVGANRVVVLDASWNPCHDCQAVCRVYRFGQTKPSFIYRFVTDNTMEKKIYDRQINKQGMSDRVVDELNPQNHFSRRHVDNLLHYEDTDFPLVDFTNCEEKYTDPVLVKVLKKNGHWITKMPFSHESLLIDKKELRLSKKEKRIAKQNYVNQKRQNISYSRPSYTAFYPKGPGGGPQQGPAITRVYPNRPIASVKPIITTPVPMRPKGIGPERVNKAGVSVHKVITTTDIMLPGSNTSSDAGAGVSGNKITAGQQIFIIKTPKGVYIRTSSGKIFSVRTKMPEISSTTKIIVSTSTTTAAASVMSSTIISPTSAGSRPSSRATIVTPSPVSTASTSGNGQRNVFKPPAMASAPDTPTNILASIYSQSQQVNSLLKQQTLDSVTSTPTPQTKEMMSSLSDKVSLSNKQDKSLLSKKRDNTFLPTTEEEDFRMNHGHKESFLTSSQEKSFLANSQEKSFLSNSNENSFLASSNEDDYLQTPQDMNFASPPVRKGFLPTSQDESFLSSHEKGFMPTTKEQSYMPIPQDKDFLPPQEKGFLPTSQENSFLLSSQENSFLPTSQKKDFLSMTHDKGYLPQGKSKFLSSAKDKNFLPDLSDPFGDNSASSSPGSMSSGNMSSPGVLSPATVQSIQPSVQHNRPHVQPILPQVQSHSQMTSGQPQVQPIQPQVQPIQPQVQQQNQSQSQHHQQQSQHQGPGQQNQQDHGQHLGDVGSDSNNRTHKQSKLAKIAPSMSGMPQQRAPQNPMSNFYLPPQIPYQPYNMGQGNMSQGMGMGMNPYMNNQMLMPHSNPMSNDNGMSSQSQQQNQQYFNMPSSTSSSLTTMGSGQNSDMSTMDKSNFGSTIQQQSSSSSMMSSMPSNMMQGFPFTPYPFPMPSPYLMQNGMPGNSPYMHMQGQYDYGQMGGNYNMPSYNPSGNMNMAANNQTGSWDHSSNIDQSGNTPQC